MLQVADWCGKSTKKKDFACCSAFGLRGVVLAVAMGLSGNCCHGRCDTSMKRVCHGEVCHQDAVLFNVRECQRKQVE